MDAHPRTDGMRASGVARSVARRTGRRTGRRGRTDGKRAAAAARRHNTRTLARNHSNPASPPTCEKQSPLQSDTLDTRTRKSQSNSTACIDRSLTTISGAPSCGISHAQFVCRSRRPHGARASICGPCFALHSLDGASGWRRERRRRYPATCATPCIREAEKTSWRTCYITLCIYSTIYTDKQY